MFSRCPSCQRMDQVTQELVFKGLVTVTSESLLYVAPLANSS